MARLRKGPFNVGRWEIPSKWVSPMRQPRGDIKALKLVNEAVKNMGNEMGVTGMTSTTTIDIPMQITTEQLGRYADQMGMSVMEMQRKLEQNGVRIIAPGPVRAGQGQIMWTAKPGGYIDPTQYFATTAGTATGGDDSMAKDKALTEAKKIIKEMEEELQRLAESPLVSGAIVDVKDEFCMVSIGSGVMRVIAPKKFKVKIGDTVWIHTKNNSIIEVSHRSYDRKVMVTITEVVDAKRAGIERSGQTVIISTGGHKVKTGDRVMLNEGENTIMENLGQKASNFVPKVPTVKWTDIGGLEEAKMQMIEVVEYPHKHKDLYEFYGKRQPKGILLYGPPGCGKTMLGKAAANALAGIYSKSNVSSGFMYIKGPEILNKYVGESEATVRNIFADARKHKEAHGYPAVIFIDEADAILSKRGSENSGRLTSTLVPMFLTEMDGMEESAAIVILATNRPDVLDPAVVRDGRIDRKIKITRPSRQHAADIMSMQLSNVPRANGASARKLAKIAVEALFSDERKMYKLNTLDGNKYLTLGHIINGAMLVNAIDYALSLALRRDLETGERQGVTDIDMLKAIENIDRTNRDTDHTDDLSDLCETLSLSKDDLAGIAKVAFKEAAHAEAA